MSRDFNQYLKAEQDVTKASKASPTVSHSKVSNTIKDNTLETVNILVKDFLDKVKANKISLHNTKELKDVITVFLQLHEVSQGVSKDTPQININAAKFMGKQLREPIDNNNLNAGVKKKVKNLNSKQVSNLINNQTKDLDKQNLKKM